MSQPIDRWFLGNQGKTNQVRVQVRGRDSSTCGEESCLEKALVVGSELSLKE